MKQIQIPLPHNFIPRGYQLPVWNYMTGPITSKRAMCIWHRRAGKDAIGINLCAYLGMQRVGVYWHLFPYIKQGRAVIWNGFTRPDAMGKSRPFLDFFPKELVADTNSTEMRVHLKNPYDLSAQGSIYQVCGTDDIDALVGTNPIGVIFSEFALHDPKVWQYVRPILRENGGWALFITTPRGQNHAYKLLTLAKDNPEWFTEVLVAGDSGTKDHDGKPIISDAEIDRDRKGGMPEEMIRQEYYCDFTSPLVGAYYGKEMALVQEENRITHVPYDPKLPVDTSWDIGFRDATAIVFSQQFGLETRLIDYYENSQCGLPHYAKVLQDKGYIYNRHYAPHDMAVHDFSSGKARIEVARGLGIKMTVTQKHEFEDGVEQVRNTLRFCWFDKVKCARLVEALKTHRPQESPQSNEDQRLFKDQALEDWSIHAADSFRTLMWNKKFKSNYQEKKQQVALDEFVYL